MTANCKIAVVIGVQSPLRLMLAKWLAGFGIDSLYVESESDGLSLTESVAPDLIIVADGAASAALLEQVLQNTKIGGNRSPKLMVCANSGSVELMSVAVARGADECLVAPFDADILQFKLEQTGVLAAQQ